MTKCSELTTSECISLKAFCANYYIFITSEYFSGISILPLFLPYLLHVLYRKPVSIAFLGNVNVRFTWEQWKDKRQLSSVIYVPHEKRLILYSSLLLFLICALSSYFKSTHWFSFCYSTWNSSLSTQKFILQIFISICTNIYDVPLFDTQRSRLPNWLLPQLHSEHASSLGSFSIQWGLLWKALFRQTSSKSATISPFKILLLSFPQWHYSKDMKRHFTTCWIVF